MPSEEERMRQQRERGARIVEAIKANAAPGEGSIVFVFDYGQGGSMSYVASAERCDCITAILEWLSRQEPEVVAIAQSRLADIHRYGEEKLV